MTSDRVLRAGVVGAGVFGRFHAQKYAAAPGVAFVGFADSDAVRAADAVKAIGGHAYASLKDILPDLDIVSVTTPASTHDAVALACLQAGKHVYVEKPIATTLDGADRMIAEAAARSLVLQTGHQERLVLGVTGLQNWTVRPISIDCVRAGPFSGRALDVSVVFDLMIHDIDLAQWIAGGRVRAVQASERAGPGGPSDEVRAQVQLDNDCKVTLLASRDSAERKRGFHAVYPDGEVSIDFLTRAIVNTTPRPLTALLGEGSTLHPDVADSVGGGVRRFLASVRGQGTPMVAPAEARAALETAIRIMAAAKHPL